MKQLRHPDFLPRCRCFQSDCKSLLQENLLRLTVLSFLFLEKPFLQVEQVN